MKSIKNKAEFARAHGITAQGLGRRIKAGWKFGVLDGKRVMYSPKHVQAVK